MRNSNYLLKGNYFVVYYYYTSKRMTNTKGAGCPCGGAYPEEPSCCQKFFCACCVIPNYYQMCSNVLATIMFLFALSCYTIYWVPVIWLFVVSPADNSDFAFDKKVVGETVTTTTTTVRTEDNY